MAQWSNEKMNEYMKRRYALRRQSYIEKLGGKCVKCESVEDLHFDHIDATTKEFDFAKRLGSASLAVLDKEIAKCQLLCRKCHERKTLEERGIDPDKENHGITGYTHRKCRCSICREAMSKYNRERSKTYKRNRKLKNQIKGL